MKIPPIFTAGDAVTWIDHATKDPLGNPIDSSLWGLTYNFRQGAVALSVTSTPYESGWQTSLTTDQTNSFSAGLVYWQAYATRSGDATTRLTIGSGQVTVKSNLATADNTYDGRTQNEQDLAAVQTAMRAIISGGAVAEYSIAGRSVRKMTMSDLITLESRLKARVSRDRKIESIKNGQGNPDNIYVRFRK